MSIATRALGPVGVELSGLDLKEPLSDPDFAQLREILLREGLVLIRNQPIPPEIQVAFGRRFGELEQLDVNNPDAPPAHMVIGNVDAEGRVYSDEDPRMKLMKINEGWHTDSSFREVPAGVSIFACKVPAEVGGDTFFASLERAWTQLSSQEQARVYGLDGVHDYGLAYRKRGNHDGGAIGYDLPPVTHPLARTHPETGRVSLYVSEHIDRVEPAPGEAVEAGGDDALLSDLVRHATNPANVYRHRWRVGDVMLWDNRSMIHRAQGFDSRYARVMHHVRVSGREAPIRAVPHSDRPEAGA